VAELTLLTESRFKSCQSTIVCVCNIYGLFVFVTFGCVSYQVRWLGVVCHLNFNRLPMLCIEQGMFVGCVNLLNWGFNAYIFCECNESNLFLCVLC
jgi:hypothetical protein